MGKGLCLAEPTVGIYLSSLSRQPKKGGELGSPPPAVFSDADKAFLVCRLNAECYGPHTKSRYF